ADPIPLRMGLHSGDIVYDGTEIYGDGVNVAARIESLGVAGSILISAKLNEELLNHPAITTRSMGHFELKNIVRPVEVYAVSAAGVRLPAPAELGGRRQVAAKSVAVLPFVNMSRQAENEYFCDGMTEEIINALSRIRHLKVTSRTSSFFFKDKKLPLRQIGRELNVSTILEGSIRLWGKRMRITAQLVDVEDDYHFWSETFDRSLEDVFAVQDEISLLIADKLREHVGHLEIDEHLVEAPQVPVETYKRYLKSRYHLLKMTKTDLDTGMAILRDILRTHPRFALAHLGIHLGYTLLGTIGLQPAAEAFALGQPHLEQAIELAPELPESQQHLAYISFLQEWDFAAAYRHLNKSFEIRPTVEYYQSMASILVAEGKFEAAGQYIGTALELDPFANINYHLKGYIAYVQEQYEQAIASFRRSLELKPSFMASTIYLGQALVLSGQPGQALEFFRALPEDEGDLVKTGGTTLALIALGETEKAQAGLEKLQAALQSDLVERALNMLIACRAIQGQYEQALELAEQGLAYRLPMMVYLFVEPLLRPLHELPRFGQLMQQVLGQDTSLELTPRKYRQALFSPDELEQHKTRLLRLMEDQQPQLDPQLSLRTLAAMLHLPPNYLSQLLNEGFGQNFAEFVNSRRLQTFNKLLREPQARQLTLLALAYQSGFNSKTVFNTYFKKKMGMTPKAYWQQLKNEKR
ncbi:MAG: helix-turn-helix domain-containing protein, partial [Bacteroidetes bacterium]